MTIAEAAEYCHVSEPFIYAWQADDPSFKELISCAREDAAQNDEDIMITVMRMELARIGDKNTTPQDVSLLRNVWEQAYKRLQVYNERYKERKAVELTGADGKDILPAPALSDEQMETMAERIARVRERLAKERADAADE